MTENNITGIIVDCCVKMHKMIGPGLLESVYEEVLAHELRKKGLMVERQVGIPVIYNGLKMDLDFRADILVDNLVLVELKSVENVLPIHKKQLLTYLKLSGKKVGLLINFNEDLIKNGITRIANGI
jgi:GxxExxY protein